MNTRQQTIKDLIGAVLTAGRLAKRLQELDPPNRDLYGRLLESLQVGSEDLDSVWAMAFDPAYPDA